MQAKEFDDNEWDWKNIQRISLYFVQNITMGLVLSDKIHT